MREINKGERNDKQRIALWVNRSEVDAVMNVLLQAPPTPEVPGDVAERLLCRVAHAQRAFYRADQKRRPVMVEGSALRRPLRRVRCSRAVR